MASALPQVSLWTQSPDGAPTKLASVTSNICTKTRPTSRRTHSSKTSMRKRPHCSEPIERLVTSEPDLRVQRATLDMAAPASLGDLR